MRFAEKWIWLPEEKYPNNQETIYSGFNDCANGNYTVAEFKRDYCFEKQIKRTVLRFSGDTSFVLFCNGQFITAGPVLPGGDYGGNDVQRPNYYSAKTEIFPNDKKLCFFARVKMMPSRMCEYSKGRGGFMLTAAVEFTDGTKRIITTDSTWLVRLNGAYKDVGEYDGGIAPDEYVYAEEINNIWHTEESPLPLLSEEKIIPEGGCIVLKPHEETETVLEFDKIYGGYLFADVKTSGIVKADILCCEDESGGISEKLIFKDDTSYRGFIFHSAGKMCLKLKNESDEKTEISVGIIFSHYPVETEAKTITSDERLNTVLDVCRHTLKICRQTIHLDSTTHCEPLGCTGDYYIETLMTAFSFGDMRLSEFDIMRTAEVLRNNDGKMFHTTYSLIWVIMLYDTYMFAGNTELLENSEDALLMLLNRFDGYIGENGLIETPPDYMFIDWIYIDGLSMHHPPKALGQTCLNMFYCGALDAAEKIFSELSEKEMSTECKRKSENIKKAVNDLLFDKEKNMYFEGLNTDTPNELLGLYMPQNTNKRYYLKHSNILAAYFGICDGETAKNLIEKIMSDECDGEIQPYFTHYLLEAVLRNGLREKYTLKI